MFYEIIHDHGETANKCTIAPLEGRDDFRVLPVVTDTRFPQFEATILLHPNGECVTQLRETLPKIEGIACIDCVWRRLDALLERVDRPLPVLARIPPGFVTAYPRVSAHEHDPEGGFATIEAIFIASALLGNWDPSLFSEYYFGRKFIELNQKRFLELGVKEAGDLSQLPPFVQRTRNSSQRKRDRGWKD